MKNLTYKLALILAIMCLGSAQAFAQQVKGTVNDTAGNPIIGAAVVVEGTTVGTTTATDGSFTINATDGQSLVVSYIGYLPQTVVVGGEEPSMRLSLRRIHKTSMRSSLWVTVRRRRAS